MAAGGTTLTFGTGDHAHQVLHGCWPISSLSSSSSASQPTGATWQQGQPGDSPQPADAVVVGLKLLQPAGHASLPAPPIRDALLDPGVSRVLGSRSDSTPTWLSLWSKYAHMLPSAHLLHWQLPPASPARRFSERQLQLLPLLANSVSLFASSNATCSRGARGTRVCRAVHGDPPLELDMPEYRLPASLTDERRAPPAPDLDLAAVRQAAMGRTSAALDAHSWFGLWPIWRAAKSVAWQPVGGLLESGAAILVRAATSDAARRAAAAGKPVLGAGTHALLLGTPCTACGQVSAWYARNDANKHTFFAALPQACCSCCSTSWPWHASWRLLLLSALCC